MNPFLALYDEATYLRRVGLIDAGAGFQPTEIFGLIMIRWDGSFLRIESLARASQNNPRTMEGLSVSAPHIGRTSGIVPRPFYDNAQYVLDPGPARDSFYERVREIAERAELAGKPRAAAIARAVQAFGETHVDGIDRPALDAIMVQAVRGRPKGLRPQLSFAIEDEGEPGDPILTDPELRSVIQPRSFNASSLRAVCCLTGVETEVARLHRMVKGSALIAAGAQTSGSSLSSFNRNTTHSYGFTGDRQYLNAPMSVEVVEAYPDALNHLLAFPQRNHTISGPDRVIVMFAARSDEAEIVTRLRNALIGYVSTDDVLTARSEMERIVEAFDTGAFEIDRQTDAAIAALSSHPRGQTTPEPLDAAGHLNILVLAPQASREAIVGFDRHTIAEAYARVLRWFSASSITPVPGSRGPAATIGQYLNALQGKLPDRVAVNPWSDETRQIFLQNLFLSATMDGPIRQEILSATTHAFARTLLGVEGTLRRAGVKPDLAQWEILRVQHRLASLAKLCLTLGPSHLRYPMPTDLDRTNDDIAYLAGRVFAAAVYAQQQALPESTLRFTAMTDAAMRTPGLILPRIHQKAQSHRDKLKRTFLRLKNGGGSAKDIGRAWATFKASDDAYQESYALLGGRPWPTSLRLIDHGVFLGAYHQQMMAFFTPAQRQGDGRNETPNGVDDELASVAA